MTQGIRESIRESAISHCLDPARQVLLKQGEAPTIFERAELLARKREEEVNALAAELAAEGSHISSVHQDMVLSFQDAKSTISHDNNFLKTGAMDCANLAGHVTNFVDNEASLDFLSQSNAMHA